MKQIDTGTMALELLGRLCVDVANTMQEYAEERYEEAKQTHRPHSHTEGLIAERMGEGFYELSQRIKETLR